MTETIVVHRDVTPALEFSQEQQQMIRDTFANGATEKEFQVLLEIAKLRKLNPLLKQIHFVKRKNKQLGRDVWSAQVSIDGLRAIAERTGKYDGQDEPEYERDKDGYILACKVKVYRKDWSRPAVGVAHWTEYVQTSTYDGKTTPTKFWADMPHVMIAKCAEAIAMRKAFPEDMGGLYVDEEMQQADNGPRLPDVTPHALPGEDPQATQDSSVADSLLSQLQAIKDGLPKCDTYDKVLSLRDILGSKAKQSALTKRIQQAGESGEINAITKQELGKLWQHCNRQVEKLERQLTPRLESSFEDPEDGTEDRDVAALDAFSPRAESEDA